MASMLSPPFSYLGEALRLVGERTGGDGLGALAAAAASGQITGEGIAFLIAPGSANPEQQGEEFTSVPDGWWAQIRLLGWRARTERELLSVTTVDVANDTISRFFFAAAPVWFPEPSLPPGRAPILKGFRHVRFPRANLDRLWPPPDLAAADPPASPEEQQAIDKPGLPPREDQALSPAQLGRDKKPRSFKKATHPQIIEHARIAPASVSTWKDKDKDKDLNPLVRQHLNAAGLDAGRDRIRVPIDEVLKERQQNS